jgi:hypothetical protein
MESKVLQMKVVSMFLMLITLRRINQSRRFYSSCTARYVNYDNWGSNVISEQNIYWLFRSSTLCSKNTGRAVGISEFSKTNPWFSYKSNNNSWVAWYIDMTVNSLTLYTRKKKSLTLWDQDVNYPANIWHNMQIEPTEMCASYLSN